MQSDGDNQPDNCDWLELLLEQQKLQGMCPTRYIGPFDQYSKISRHTSITISNEFLDYASNNYMHD